MDKKYIELLRNLAQTTAVSAEQVMEYNHNNGDSKGERTAATMRDDYQELVEKLNQENYSLTRADSAKFLVASMVVVNQLQDQINNRKKAISGYQTTIIPTLQKIMDTAQNDEEANKIAEENFIIKNQE